LASKLRLNLFRRKQSLRVRLNQSRQRLKLIAYLVAGVGAADADAGAVV
jgi:hypothetical protein